MLLAINKKYSSDDLIKKMLKAKPKLNTTLEQKDTESLNTMEYYNEDSSNKNSLIEEAKKNNKLLFNTNVNEISQRNKKLKPNQKEKALKINKTNIGIYKNSDLIRTMTDLNYQKIKNGVIQTNSLPENGCKCKSKFVSPKIVCLNCKKHFCPKCFEGNPNRNLDNNTDNFENYEQNCKNENICINCKINAYNQKHFKRQKQKTGNHLSEICFEPLDTCVENLENKIMKSKKIISENNGKEKIKNKILEEQYKEYENLINQIENKKKEIEYKKDISLNLLQIIKKAIEFEYEKNLNKLNEFITKLNKLKNNINEKINLNYKNEIDIQIDADISRKNLKNFSKIYENYIKKILLKPVFRGYKLYETDTTIINYSDTYYMKNKEVSSVFPFGNIYIKIDRYTNNYINYFNFSTIIKLNDEERSNDITSSQSVNNNKSRFLVNMIVNNKLIRLNKTNKDSNDLSLNYESFEEENKILVSKNNGNNTIKKNNLNVKVIIFEIML